LGVVLFNAGAPPSVEVEPEVAAAIAALLATPSMGAASRATATGATGAAGTRVVDAVASAVTAGAAAMPSGCGVPTAAPFGNIAFEPLGGAGAVVPGVIKPV
jgi:hypothetical protein